MPGRRAPAVRARAVNAAAAVTAAGPPRRHAWPAGTRGARARRQCRGRRYRPPRVTAPPDPRPPIPRFAVPAGPKAPGPPTKGYRTPRSQAPHPQIRSARRAQGPRATHQGLPGSWPRPRSWPSVSRFGTYPAGHRRGRSARLLAPTPFLAVGESFWDLPGRSPTRKVRPAPGPIGPQRARRFVGVRRPVNSGQPANIGLFNIGPQRARRFVGVRRPVNSGQPANIGLFNIGPQRSGWRPRGVRALGAACCVWPGLDVSAWSLSGWRPRGVRALGAACCVWPGLDVSAWSLSGWRPHLRRCTNRAVPVCLGPPTPALDTSHKVGIFDAARTARCPCVWAHRRLRWTPPTRWASSTLHRGHHHPRSESPSPRAHGPGRLIKHGELQRPPSSAVGVAKPQGTRARPIDQARRAAEATIIAAPATAD